jgi:hypothetical protein
VNPFRGLLRNWSATGRLEPRYYWLTGCVGLIGGSLGAVGFTLLATNELSRFLGISPDAPLLSQPNGSLWLVAFAVGFLLAVYAGAALVAGVVGIIMVRLGKCTATEALHYALFSRYPESWLKKNMRNSYKPKTTTI